MKVVVVGVGGGSNNKRSWRVGPNKIKKAFILVWVIADKAFP
jgi:hypothetical protein